MRGINAVFKIRLQLFLLLSLFAVILVTVLTKESSSMSVWTRIKKPYLTSKNVGLMSEIGSLADSIWPPVEDDGRDRIESQLKLADILAKYIPHQNDSGSEGKKVILIGELQPLQESFAEGSKLFENDCPITNCWLTQDTLQYKRTAAAIVFVKITPWNLRHYLPKPSNQIWIAALKESPVRTHYRHDQCARYFINWTYSSRTDSTIVFRTHTWLSTPTKRIDTQNRTSRAAWLVSNCNPVNKRRAYVSVLKQFFPVDIYGRCDGGQSCKKKSLGVCARRMLQRKYKFYLAFENSNCEDYITEKVYRNSFTFGMLPVVMGARLRDYEKVLPPHSFIHVDNLAGPEQLGKYLHYLSHNDTAYEEYFRWRETMSISEYKNNGHFWCRLCTLLNYQEITGYTHWYDDFRKWWHRCDAHSKKLPWYRWPKDS